MQTSKRIVALVTAAVITILGFAGAVSADHSWSGYHWARTANEFTIKLGDNVTAGWKPFLVTTSVDWTLSNVLDTVIVAGNTNSKKGRNTPKNCVPTAGQGEICNATYGATGWLGIATIWASGSHITQGTVKLNDTYFSTATYNTTAWKNMVMCQEVGHIFGLGHQDEVFANGNLDTCMDYTDSPESNQHPNQHDYDMLAQMYAHLDSSTTIAATAASSRAEDSNDPKAWGKEVSRSDDGRVSLFVQDSGNGQKIIRHVFWAEPRGNQHHDVE